MSLPHTWRMESLNELAAGGRFVDGDWVESKDQDPVGTVRLTQLADVGTAVFRDRSDRWMREDQARRLACTRLRPSDILIARMPDPIGRACLVPATIGEAVTAVDVAILRLARQDVEPGFVMWAINSPAFHQSVVALQSGTTRKRISRRNLGLLSIPVPPLEEQRRIVDVLEDHLSRLDAGRNDLRAARKRLLSYARAARHQLTTAGASSLVPLQALVGTVEAGRSFGVSARPAAADEWGIVKVSAMTWGAFDENQNKAVLEESRVQRRFEILPGDLLVSRANTTAYVGASVVVPACRRKLLLSDKSLRLVPRADVDPRYIHALLQAPEARDQISRLATGTKDSMRNISQSALLSITVPSHAAGDQAILVNRVDELQRQVGRLGAQFDRSALRESQLRRSLLGAAFSGRL